MSLCGLIVPGKRRGLGQEIFSSEISMELFVYQENRWRVVLKFYRELLRPMLNVLRIF
jgi:hypothetical protein